MQQWLRVAPAQAAGHVASLLEHAPALFRRRARIRVALKLGYVFLVAIECLYVLGARWISARARHTSCLCASPHDCVSVCISSARACTTAAWQLPRLKCVCVCFSSARACMPAALQRRRFKRVCVRFSSARACTAAASVGSAGASSVCVCLLQLSACLHGSCFSWQCPRLKRVCLLQLSACLHGIFFS
jgi:hypothetical protein